MRSSSRPLVSGLRARHNDWFQPFELDAGLTVGKGNALEIVAGGRAVRLSLGTGYYPLAATPNDDATVPSHDLDALALVFAGYGISAPSSKYDDYAGLDVMDKAVLIFSHEPQEARPDSRLNGAQPVAGNDACGKSRRRTQPRRQGTHRRIRPIAPDG